MTTDQQSDTTSYATSLAEILFGARNCRRTWLILPTDPVSSVDAQRLTFSDLYRRAAEVATGFRSRGATPGRTVGILANNTVDFPLLLFGAILAGLIPTPLHIPALGFGNRDQVERILGILVEGDAQFLAVGDEFDGVAGKLHGTCCESLTTGDLLTSANGQPVSLPMESGADDVTLVQYSSGSTRAPMGVELTNRSVISNIHGIGRTVGVSSTSDVALAWVPLFHDMGLIGTLLYSWYWRIPLVLLSPRAFLTRPASWLWAISRFSVTQCAAPNFAYAICADPTKVPDRAIAGISLRNWRAAFNGAELVQANTISRFCRRMEPYGFRREAVYPVYGLAENAAACCFPKSPRVPKVDRISRQKLALTGVASCGDVSDPSDVVREVVSVGTPIAGTAVRITDSVGKVVGDRTVGQVELTGQSVMKRYLGRPRETAAVLDPDGWLRTGDLGYLADDELYLVGRLKSTINKAGAKYDGTDIQNLVSDIEGIRAGCVVALGLNDEAQGTEQLIVLAETRLIAQPDLNRLAHAIQRRIVDAFVTTVDVLLLLPAGELDKTSSGKIRLGECLRKYQTGTLRSLWPTQRVARSNDPEPEKA